MADFARFEHDAWQRTAAGYEASWSSLTRQFIPDLFESVGTVSGQRLLDVACGPGDVTDAARRKGLRATGVDFSAEMIRLARRRHPGLEFREGDAHALPLADSEFDVVVMNFGALHLSNPEVAFSEAFRVLRPGGSFGFTVWASPESNPGGKIVEDAIAAHADTPVDVPAGPSYFGFSEPEACRRLLKISGFDPASMQFGTTTVGWGVPTASFLFDAERYGGVRIAARLAGQTREALQRISWDIERSVERYATADGFTIPFAAHVVAARVATAGR